MRVGRLVLVAALAANVAAGSAFAPEHMHERDERHPTATVHSHVTAHHATTTSSHARIDDDDDHVVWLTAAWLPAAQFHGPVVASAPTSWFTRVAPETTWSTLVLDEAAPPHGPPRQPRSLRAPPIPRLA
jgi:hypothetical protein